MIGRMIAVLELRQAPPHGIRVESEPGSAVGTVFVQIGNTQLPLDAEEADMLAAILREAAAIARRSS